MRTFHVVNLGCKVNKVEADVLAAEFLAAGDIAVSQESADLIVVNTCTVTGEADKKARKAVRHALSVNDSARVIVTGCAVAIHPETFANMSSRVETIPRTDLLLKLSGGKRSGALRLGQGFRTRVNVKVQDGCNHACTYCIVHVARGKAQSVPFADVLAETSAYLSKGVKEIVLTGIDLASYNDGGRHLADLSYAILEQADALCPPGEKPARVRASSIEPQTLGQEFVNLMAQSEGRLCRHMHLPLQSGSNKVLREMARPYNAEWYADLVNELYARMPSLALTTDIICGFPGETEDEFEETLELARFCRFSKIHVFPYSKRDGTPAAARLDQVDATEKAARAAKLRNLSDSLRDEDRQRRTGSRELALVEGAMALSESYHELPVPKGAKLGDMIEVVFSGNAIL